ncbi:helix-turn-helix domain-containing GNAT family N-acetyltransferase [uncultured Maribacter sp.]|uniref:bifunctional helix-turn-helix transcriptional regulator/GNAT family N-acetyltransferase n=1 Tax=uncultured Maribacter sp. TaxID=431308 RepID=UPI0026271CD7|nr:helix-turn-helix domain-containing GNAT family N-acetyltransferase [uncultured Maribacter sp.]
MNFDEIGEMVIGSRLRALSETITKDAKVINDMYHVDLKPKWFPVYYYLSNQESESSITTIAKAINHSHPSVIKIVKEMLAAGLVKEKKDKSDGRKNNILLTTKGKRISKNIAVLYSDVDNAIKKALSNTKHNLWHALQEFEFLLNEKSLVNRVLEQQKKRESQNIDIVAYSSIYKSDFKKLNEEWILKYFKIEDADKKALDNPETYILNRGGKILVALDNREVLGVCALLKMNHEIYDYELAKMAVSPNAQGKGVGFLLGKAIIKEAKLLGAKNVYLESNTILKPAISLYQKLGFTKVFGNETPYERSNIQMELILKH